MPRLPPEPRKGDPLNETMAEAGRKPLCSAELLLGRHRRTFRIDGVVHAGLHVHLLLTDLSPTADRYYLRDVTARPRIAAAIVRGVNAAGRAGRGVEVLTGGRLDITPGRDAASYNNYLFTVLPESDSIVDRLSREGYMPLGEHEINRRPLGWRLEIIGAEPYADDLMILLRDVTYPDVLRYVSGAAHLPQFMHGLRQMMRQRAIGRGCTLPTPAMDGQDAIGIFVDLGKAPAIYTYRFSEPA